MSAGRRGNKEARKPTGLSQEGPELKRSVMFPGLDDGGSRPYPVAAGDTDPM